MGIESFLGDGDKLDALNQLKTMLAKELYIACINCNIDPESFEVGQYINYINENPSINIGPERTVLLQLCNKFSLIETKIAELE